MATNQGTILLLAGAGALLLMAGKKKRRRAGRAPTNGSAKEEEVEVEEEVVEVESDLDEEEEDDFEPEDVVEEEEEIFEEMSNPSGPDQVLIRNVSPDGKATLGKLYQIKMGDTPLEICREALFGTRELVTDAVKRQAAKDLLVRIDCSPYNQALYGVPLSELNEGHANIDSYFTAKGVSFDPIYQDNYKRIMDGEKPTSESGDHLALIYIPMVNLDLFDTQGVITTEGMYYPDNVDGMGHSMIMPPREVLDLQFDEVTSPQVGCELPEGDYRQTIVATP